MKRLLSSIVLSLCLILAGCTTTTQNHADPSRLWSIAESSDVFQLALEAFSGSGHSLAVESAIATSSPDGSSLLAVGDHAQTHMLLVHFDATLEVEDVFVVQLESEDAPGRTTVVNIGSGTVVELTNQSESDGSVISNGFVSGYENLQSLTTVLPPEAAISIQCAACQRELEDAQAADAAYAGALAAEAAAAAVAAVVCAGGPLTAPACVAALAVVAAAFVQAVIAGNEAVRMWGYYDDCVAMNC